MIGVVCTTCHLQNYLNCSSGFVRDTKHLEALDVAVGLQAGEENVKKPQTKEQQCGKEAWDSRTSQLTADGRPSPKEQNGHADEGKDSEEGDREGQRSRIHFKRSVFYRPVDCGD